MQDFTAAPFRLDDEAVAWVRRTLASLSPEDRLRQLFNLRLGGNDPAEIAAALAFRPGGITRKGSADHAAERAIVAQFNAALPVPVLVSADLEGSRASLPSGAEWPNPIALAAIDDPALTAEVTRRMAAEAHASGINWSFTPVLDIDATFRSPIVPTRGYGADVDTIARHTRAQIEAFQAAGIAATAKHWPGEGYDDRDQHLVTTINPLDLAAWEATFGRLYRQAIEAGVMAVMSAHIAFPAFVRAVAGDCGVEAFRPASVSRLLNQDLLRDRLGFRGLIVSDATPMAGLGAWAPRAVLVPEIVSSGCDVILFSDDPERDLRFLKDALADGRLDWARVDDAVARQLALKAAVGLHRRPVAPPEPDVAGDRAFAAAIARRAPTLVKDVRGTLPLSPARHRRVLVVSGGIVFPFKPDPLPFALPAMLEREGFAVTLWTPETAVSPDHYDLMLYLFGEETLLTRGRIFLDWLRLTGQFGLSMKRYWHDIPTVMLSFGYPYMLYDAPRVPAYVNAYSTTETMQAAVVDCLLGRSPWNRHSPVDPFCGLEDARY